MRAFIVILVSAGLAPVTSGGCGYHLGHRPPPSVQTIAVPIFDNVTFPLRRDIEYALTSALRREIQVRTPLRLVDDDSADMTVYGKVAEFQERTVAETATDRKLESRFRITVHLVIEDYVNGTVTRKTVKDTEPFSIEPGQTLDAAQRRAVDNLSEKILLAIEAW